MRLAKFVARNKTAINNTDILLQERRGTAGDRRPVKVWNANRNIKKALVVGTYDEFLRKGK